MQLSVAVNLRIKHIYFKRRKYFPWMITVATYSSMSKLVHNKQVPDRFLTRPCPEAREWPSVRVLSRVWWGDTRLSRAPGTKDIQGLHKLVPCWTGHQYHLDNDCFSGEYITQYDKPINELLFAFFILQVFEDIHTFSDRCMCI